MNQKILDKLKKLIKMEQSARKIESIHEAEQFADKIQELLDEYSLSMSDIDIKEEEVSGINKDVFFKSFKEQWKFRLVRDIGKVNGCSVIYNNPSVIVVGLETDRQIVMELYTYFSDLGEHLAALQQKEASKQLGYSPSKYRKSFLFGYATTLGARLIKMHERAMKRVESTSTALIFIGNKLAKADEFVKGNMNIKTEKMRAPSLGSIGYEDGKRAGNSVTLSEKVFGGKNVKQIN